MHSSGVHPKSARSSLPEPDVRLAETLEERPPPRDHEIDRRLERRERARVELREISLRIDRRAVLGREAVHPLEDEGAPRLFHPQPALIQPRRFEAPAREDLRREVREHVELLRLGSPEVEERRDLRRRDQEHRRAHGRDCARRGPHCREPIMVRDRDDSHPQHAPPPDVLVGRRAAVGEERVPVEVGRDVHGPCSGDSGSIAKS